MYKIYAMPNSVISSDSLIGIVFLFSLFLCSLAVLLNNLILFSNIEFISVVCFLQSSIIYFLGGGGDGTHKKNRFGSSVCPSPLALF